MSSTSPATTTGAPQAPQYLSHRQILVVMSGLMLGMLLAALDQTIVSTAMPTIVGDLGGLEHLSWVATAYLLTSTAATPLYGKISDLYGRKPVFQFAIIVFLVGSALAGIAHSMTQLIAFRALQGIGAGGLMTLVFAIIGDIIPPRERGRYQGYFAGVFGLSSVAGPLLGGFFTQHLSWRWIFYINLPIGLVALVVVASVLQIPHTRREHSIDWLGASLLVSATSSLLLYLSWAGPAREYGWGHPLSVTLAAVAAVLTVAFVAWESRAAEPILPLRLFRNGVFSVTSGLGFIVGLSMFGAIIYIPVYLQVVDGVSPTESGLRMLPLMLGLLVTSIGSGRAISKMGRYKIFPVIGTGVIAVGMFLLSRLGVDTSFWESSLAMLVVGAGLGFVMQVLIVAVQNSVDFRDMGIATSASTFFRSMGGTLGIAIFGAILSSRLATEISARLPDGGGVPAGDLTNSPKKIAALPPAVHDKVIDAFVASLHTVYVVAVPIALAGFVLSWFLRELPLRTGGPTETGNSADAPAPAMALD